MSSQVETAPVPDTQELFYTYPRKVASYKKYNVPYQLSQEDLALTEFFNSAVPESIESTIRSMARVRAVSKNVSTGKLERGEYITWLEELRGTDQRGNSLKIVTDIPKGIDYEISAREIYTDSQGRTVPIIKPSPELTKLYLVPYSPSKIEELVSSSVLTDQFSIAYCIKSSENSTRLTVGTYSEFKDLPFEELQLRNRMNRTAFPTDMLFSKLTGSQLLAEENRSKK